ncbi:MAG: hypothetical protein KJ647_08310 [Candidatus Omnitrophica bacterium]|nr:hypothetical protein [Candidatus Omnitrophota bacterium]
MSEKNPMEGIPQTVKSPENSKEKQKPHENIYMHEWMAQEMIDEVKKDGHNPEIDSISFSAGYNKGGGPERRSNFFVMNFKDGEQWFRAYWNPETKGEKLEIEYSGEAAKEQK